MKEMRLFLAFMAVSCLLAACQMENDYEDCILNNIGKAKTEKAALAIRAACASRHPRPPFSFEEATAPRE